MGPISGGSPTAAVATDSGRSGETRLRAVSASMRRWTAFDCGFAARGVAGAVACSTGAGHVMIMAAHCRAAGNPDPNGAKPFAAGGELLLDDHPDAPGAWTLFPVFAFMELDRACERNGVLS